MGPGFGSHDGRTSSQLGKTLGHTLPKARANCRAALRFTPARSHRSRSRHSNRDPGLERAAAELAQGEQESLRVSAIDRSVVVVIDIGAVARVAGFESSGLTGAAFPP